MVADDIRSGSLGLERGTVRLAEHNEDWHRLFEEEEFRLSKAVNGAAFEIEHIGSTAICGISAKPILDIMIGVPTYTSELSFRPQIESLGYEYKGEDGVPERHFFGKGVPRTVHLNVVEKDGEFWSKHIAFREHLRNDRAAAVKYDLLKRSLAKRFASDRESYTNGKEEFVRQILSGLNKHLSI